MNKYKAIDLLEGTTNLYEFFETVYNNLKAAADKAGERAGMQNFIATILHNGFRVVYDNPEQIEYISTMFHSALYHDSPLHDNEHDICDHLPRLCGMVSNVINIDCDKERYARFNLYDVCYIFYILGSSLFSTYYGEDDGDEPPASAIRIESERIWHEICSM